MDKNVEKLVFTIVTVFMVVCELVTLLIPAVLAYNFGWCWLLSYPTMLLLAAALSKASKK